MKKLLIVTFLVCFSTCALAQKGKFMTKITYPRQLDFGEEYVDEDNGIELNFTASYGDITFYLFNKNKERVYIEWENAKLQSSRIVFGDDTRLTMGRAKADEVVMGYSHSEWRDIIPQRYVSSDYIIPLYNIEKLKEGEKASFSVVIPVKFESGMTIDYRLHFDVIYKNEADYSSLKVGMKQAEVKAVMDKPNKTISNGQQLIWIYTNNVTLKFMKNKLTEILPCIN